MANVSVLVPSTKEPVVGVTRLIGRSWLNWVNGVTSRLPLAGVGSPEGVVTASPGKIYLNLLGGAGVTLWVKESGTSSNTGWISK